MKRGCVLCFVFWLKYIIFSIVSLFYYVPV